MIRSIIFLMSIFTFFITFSINLSAHGVSYESTRKSTVVIRVIYGDGEPMSYAEVKIFSPDNSNVEYQNLHTDKNGYFSFLPKVTGDWKIAVNDGQGHGLTVKIPIKDIDKEMEIESHHHELNHWQKLIIALSIVWGFAGFYFFFKSRKNK